MSICGLLFLRNDMKLNSVEVKHLSANIFLVFWKPPLLYMAVQPVVIACATIYLITPPPFQSEINFVNDIRLLKNIAKM